jgi:uncharacterized protein with HEPN domain
MKYTEDDIFADALEHLNILTQHQHRGGIEDQLIIDAISMRLLAAIDVLSRLPDDRRDALFGDSWHAMRGLRNRIVHGYAEVDPTIIAATMDHNVPQVIAILRRELGD